MERYFLAQLPLAPSGERRPDAHQRTAADPARHLNPPAAWSAIAPAIAFQRSVSLASCVSPRRVSR